MTNTDQTGQPECGGPDNCLQCREAQKALDQQPEPYNAEKKRQLRPAAEQAFDEIRPVLEGQQPEDGELREQLSNMTVVADVAPIDRRHTVKLANQSVDAIVELVIAWADRRADRRSQAVGVDGLREEIHMQMLAKSENAKNCGELTVIPLGHAVTIAVAAIQAKVTEAYEKGRRDEQKQTV